MNVEVEPDKRTRTYYNLNVLLKVWFGNITNEDTDFKFEVL